MTPHPQADLLRAIAEGRQMQYDLSAKPVTAPIRWFNVSADTALRKITEGDGVYLRIKPERKSLAEVLRDDHTSWFHEAARAPISRDYWQSLATAAQKWFEEGGA